MRHVVTILSTMPGPQEGPRTTNLVGPRMIQGVEKVLEKFGIPPNTNVCVITSHPDEDCPRHGGPSGVFDGCICEAMLIDIAIPEGDELKLAAASGKATRATAPEVNPMEAN